MEAQHNGLQRETILALGWRSFSWYFGKEYTDFYHYPMSLPKFKRNGVIPLAEEILRQPNIDSVMLLSEIYSGGE